MSKSTYKGDNPGKKVARARVWLSASTLMTAMQIPYMGAYVLAGNGGDVATLKALGFNPGTITAVDTDKKKVELCQQLYPGIQSVVGEAGAVSSRAMYNSAHLDFCNGLTLENIETAARVAKNAAVMPSVISVTMMKGREAPAKYNRDLCPALNRSQRRSWLADIKKGRDEHGSGGLVGAQLLKRGSFDPLLCIQRAKNQLKNIWPSDGSHGFNYEKSGHKNRDFTIVKNGKLTPLGNGTARVAALRGCLEKLLIPHGIYITLGSVFSYHSKCEKSGGTPFVAANLIICTGDQHAAIQQLLYKLAGDLFCFENIPGGESKTALREYALAACKGLTSAQVGQLFDIPEGKVRAWRAHDTMGTYADDKAAARYRAGGDGESGPKRSRIEFASNEDLDGRGAYIQAGWGRMAYSPSAEARSQFNENAFDEFKNADPERNNHRRETIMGESERHLNRVMDGTNQDYVREFTSRLISQSVPTEKCITNVQRRKSEKKDGKGNT